MATKASSTAIVIDDEFRSLIPALSDEERAQLTANVMREGCLDDLIAWPHNGKRFLLDGHNRFEICADNEIPFGVKELDLEDRDAAKDWIITHQLGRRNLKPEQMAYLRGKKYAVAKRRHGDRGKAKEKSGQNGQSFSDTRQRIAKETGVGERTISRNEEFADAVDALAAKAGPAVRAALLQGDVKMSNIAAPLVEELSAKQQKQVGEMVKAGEVKSVDEAIREVAPNLMKPTLQQAIAANGTDLKGVGVFRANEAVDCLKRIPKNDALRKRGFQIVKDWIKAHS